MRYRISLLIALVSVCMTTQAWPKDVATKIADVERRVLRIEKGKVDLEKHVAQQLSELRGTIDDIKKRGESIQDISKKTIESANLYITTVGILAVGFTLIVGVVGSIVSFFGFKEYRKLTKLGDDSKKVLEKSILLARASHFLVLSDVVPIERRPHLVNLGLTVLNVLLAKGLADADIYIWKGVALKRLGDVTGALEAAQNALAQAREGTFEYRRALYNKACYLAVLGRQDEALSVLPQAIAGDNFLIQLAKIDQDLLTLNQQRLEEIFEKLGAGRRGAP